MNLILPNWLERVEAVLGGLLALLIAVSVITTSAIIAFERRADGILEGTWRYGLMSVICFLEALHVYALYRSIGKRPYAAAVALSLPRVPLLLRLPVAVFWLLHLLFAMGFIWVAEYGVQGASVPQRFLLVLLALGLSYLAFGYLLNTVASLKSEEPLISRMWRGRAWYAVAIAIVVIFLPYTGFVSDEQSREKKVPNKSAPANPRSHLGR